MKLGQIIELQNVDPAISQLEITDLASHSNNVADGVLFFALQGSKTNGLSFIKDAVEKGAAAVVVERSNRDNNEDQQLRDLDCKIIEVDNIRLTLAKASAKFYAPQPEVVVAVTGTSGKTSVTSFLRQIWQYNKLKAANVGTTGVISDNWVEDTSLTTPDSIVLHKILQRLANDGVTHTAIEASSHGLDQYRLDGVSLKTAGFTNLGRDHMDYHHDKAHYLNSKLSLFSRILDEGDRAVIFADDEVSENVANYVNGYGRVALTVGRKGKFIKLKRVEHERFRQILDLEIEGKFYQVRLPLAGDFQVSNALVALGLAIVSGVAVDTAVQALEKLTGASGRLDLVGFTASHAPVYVDYAHKPEALENVLQAVKPFTIGRVILVFGCGGDRDKVKRPIMGEIAQNGADVVIVTDDNPRSENAEEIRKQILATCPKALEIADRHIAISTAIQMLKEGDTLIIAGKGHEKGQIVGDQIFPFSDHEEVKKLLS